ncbi:MULTISPECIES: histidinol-phosphate transaminase [Trichocoleus]|uniref:Histidinol-phosphate aminotransferase n=1 Tax=Trichocoleus desertorum GB2-A4 TaxID=2933944 RepID=A0ABV0J956_9CYAN|nr:histidinol-phosphate transaminase [Trichocoleus sp. FACHB-46]MBD1864682.1 histidinol-phosphate transaminase [Trichocoleus sp. FACHB-46]
MSSYFRPNVEAMKGHTPSHYLKPGSPSIKLNSNENPYPPSPTIRAVLQNLDLEYLRRYPDANANELRQAIAAVLQIPLDWIIVGNGCDELLHVVARACAEGKRQVVYPTPTYMLYPLLTEIQPADRIEVADPADGHLPIESLVAANGAVTFITAPNSPFGHGVAIAELRELAARLTGVLVIDEAYVDFAEETALPLVQEFENVIILRTLSKGYSLAGLRLGFGIAQPQLLQGLLKVKDTYNIDAIAALVGAAAMRDQTYKDTCVAKVKASRTKLAQDLQHLAFRVWNSQTNFLLVEPPQKNAEQIFLALREQDIWIRYFHQPGLKDKLRITIGTNEQNQTLWEGLRQWRNI